ncbi:COP1-INTERACTING PROTEIN-LIKE PROTEIN [Salix viminalis]|uniref:COP1-INTERACTING PROTEIN-LIKE PROTEIN n=1 Tax=Salix viminalis TaxID=40686 RepID=A0A9Q0Z574_SALVM|nr:COP1-INTERACTING PROTEIN-LIKE PROTEIN [Salix viminalis]
MKSSTRLDSAIFQLTPTRTRCDLIICVNGKTEKIASGLVQPFLDHLKTAQDQLAKGGYSIILEPGTDAAWFTKGTFERFVRFVSTPEVLERVYNLESEILQIEKGIAIQSNSDIGLSSVEDNRAKPAECIEGSRPITDSSEEKAIVLYKPGSHPPEANGLTVQEGNSKVQLLKVLETRKTSLQKEQGMAFARAVAAGFDIDHMAHLMSFAESFGAVRLMDACVRFMELWKRKHETGQWVEIEAAEMSGMNAPGIILSDTINKSWPETPDSNRKAGVDPNADERPPTDQQPSPGQQEYFQGQFLHPMFPPWPIHSPPGAVPVFPGYPMQGIPYYQNYPGNNPVFQPPYPSAEDPKIHAGQRMRQRRHSMDSNNEPEAWEVGALRTGSQDEAELEKETSRARGRGRKGSRSGKKQSGTVVIRNLNYITSKTQDSSGSESQSASGSENDKEDEVLSDTAPNVKHRNSLRSLKRKGSHTKSTDELNLSDMAGTSYGKEDGGHWTAFQNYLLKDADEAERAVDQGMFAMEKNVQARRQNTMCDDPLVFDGRDPVDNQEGDVTVMQKISGNLTRMTKASKDELLLSRKMGQPNDDRRFINGQMDLESAEIDGRRGRYRMNANDDFIIRGQENRSGYRSSASDPRALNGFETAKNDLDKRSSINIDDDSYIVSLRSMSLDQVENEGRSTMDVESEFPSTVQRTESLSNRSQVKYEPDDLSLMPERGTEKGSIGYDPALDYEMQALLHKKNKEVVAGQGSKKSEKDRKSKPIPDTSDRKKKVGPIRKGKPSKLSPLDEAKARAERLRTFKADLQKIKKEKEEEEIKRLEGLKLERQKRIAARGSSTTAQTASQRTRKQLPIKLSPSSQRGSKFSDSEPGSSSPLQRFSIKTVSAGSVDSQKVSRSSKLSTGTTSTAGNRLTRSVSSLSEPKKENSGVTPDSKASMTRIRRLSEPKISSRDHTSSIKPQNTDSVSKPKLSSGADSKKISALMNHDKSKVASLPELKTKTTKRHEVAPGNSAAKEISQKMNKSKSISTSKSTELKQNGNKISHQSDGDDNPIIEKTVVLECEKPSIPSVHASEQKIEVQDGHSNNYKIVEKTETVVDYAAIRAPVSPLTMDAIDRNHIEHQLPNHPRAHEAASEHASHSEKELPKLSSTHIAEKPYHSPYARVSFMEDHCTENSEHGKATPASLQSHSAGAETIKVHVSDLKSLKLEQIPEASVKPQTKESSKGFRRLLKFGRKSHTAGECNVESDNVSLNGSEMDDNAASSSEVHTLKNLISQDETPTAGSNQKTSRHFSLLSPFRSKSGEKKMTT